MGNSHIEKEHWQTPEPLLLPKETGKYHGHIDSFPFVVVLLFAKQFRNIDSVVQLHPHSCFNLRLPL